MISLYIYMIFFCLFYFFIRSTGMALSALYFQTNTATFLVLTFGLYIYICHSQRTREDRQIRLKANA